MVDCWHSWKVSSRDFSVCEESFIFIQKNDFPKILKIEEWSFEDRKKKKEKK